MKNINSTGSCYDSIPESLRNRLKISTKILVQTLLKFILIANSFKKIARPTHVMDRYRSASNLKGLGEALNAENVIFIHFQPQVTDWLPV